MKDGLRQSMAWLHTYSGLLVGWVLFLVFAAGTASYFKDEITFWMQPELHQTTFPAPPQPEVAARAVAMLQERASTSPRWFITLPTVREPGVRAVWARPPSSTGEAAGAVRRARFDSATLDPQTGAALSLARETRGGEFFYRLHFDLHYLPAVWARWIIGACAMFMLVALLSGVVTHRRIFADFFTFRPRKGQRSWLDAHNAVAVLALPYHLMITYTGLVTLMFLYMPWGPQVAYRGDQAAFLAEAFAASGFRDTPPRGIAAPLAPMAPMVAQASAYWGGAPVGRITVNHPNDAAATVSITRQEGHDMSSAQPAMVFDGVTGRPIATAGEAQGPAGQTRSTLYALHLARFANPFMRGLFFLSGLAGCVMVATGLLLWAVKERQKLARAAGKDSAVSRGVARWVDGLNLAAIAGLPIAMAGFFWANRLLPPIMAARAQAEINVFFALWGMAAVAAMVCPTRRMWQGQLGLGSLLFLGVPVLNAFTTTHSHLGHTLGAGQWRLAGFDLVCAALGMALMASAAMLSRRGSPATRAHSANGALVPPARAAQ